VQTVPAPAIAAPLQEPAPQSAVVAATAVPVTQSGGKTTVGNTQSTGAGGVEGRSPNAQNGGFAAEPQKPAATLGAGATDTVPTLQRTETFFLLAAGLSVLILFAGVFSRIRRRAVIITDYPASSDGDGFGHPIEAQSPHASPYEEQDLPFIDPQEPHGLADLYAQH
jgi:hypothetical protein